MSDSTNTKEVSDNSKEEEVDDELAALIDSAIEDLHITKKDNPTISSSKESTPSKKSVSQPSTSNKDPISESLKDIPNIADDWSNDYVEFQKQMNSIVNGDPSQLDGLLEKLMNEALITDETTAKESKADSSTTNKDPTTDSKSLEQKLSETIENLTKSLDDIPNDSFGDMMSDAMGGNGAGMMPFLEGIMQQFMSKEVLYPVFSETCQKYPEWLEAHKDSEDHNKYSAQYSIMQKIVDEFDTEKTTDSAEIKKIRFSKILELLHEMQKYGSPPKDLVGEDNLNSNNLFAGGNSILEGFESASSLIPSFLNFK